MARAAGRPLVEALSADRSRLVALAYREADGGASLWLANLRDVPQRVVLAGIDNARVSRLDESTFAAAATDPSFLQTQASALVSAELEIAAHGVLRIQTGR
jgi:D-apionolactonase